MHGKVAIVTGASSGIGQWAAIALAECGARVAVTYHRNRAGGEETCRRIVAAGGGEAILLRGDVSVKESAQEQIRAAEAALGPIDILVNNAGDLIERCPLPNFSEELFDRVVATNLKSVLFCSQAVMPGMMERRRGTIINLGSIACRHGGGPGATIYASMKATVMCLTKGMAREMALYGVRVNGIVPGVIDTLFHERLSTPEQMAQFVAGIPMGRAGTSEECGRVIAFLASEATGYLHGGMIEVNGGQMML